MAKYLTVFVALAILGCASAQKYTHSEALAKVNAVGISVTSTGGCSDRNNPECTSLEQVRTNSIDTGSGGITMLKTASGCPITITGGTETGHGSGEGYSHWNGYKIDIRLTSCIENYITTYFTFIGYRGDGAAMYESGSGNIYAKESDHWDITYY